MAVGGPQAASKPGTDIEVYRGRTEPARQDFCWRCGIGRKPNEPCENCSLPPDREVFPILADVVRRTFISVYADSNAQRLTIRRHGRTYVLDLKEDRKWS